MSKCNIKIIKQEDVNIETVKFIKSKLKLAFNTDKGYMITRVNGVDELILIDK